MPALSDLQRRFAAALGDPALPPPTGSLRRFGVHRNNVRAGILGVLDSRFPAVKRLVGDEFFLGMCQLYMEREPPTSPILILYGGGFPAFVEGFQLVDDVPYLADVARLEWLQHEAANAADAAPIGAAELSTVPQGAVAGLRLGLHPSLRLFASTYPALTIWEMNSAPGEVAARKLEATPEHALLLRPALSVEIRRIAPAFHALTAALQAGWTLGDAVEAARATSGDFDIERSLAGLIAMGALTGFDPPAPPDVNS